MLLLLGGNIIGGLIARRAKPQVPKFKPIDIQKEQAKAIAGNIAAMPQIADLARQVTATAAESREALYPGTAAISGATVGQIESMLRGELPEDVKRQIAQRAAERGVAMGTGGSQFGQFGELRSVGLTSLERIDRGISAAMQWMNIAQAGLQFGQEVAGSMMVGPQFQAQFAAEERTAQFQRDWVANQVKSAFAKATIWGQGMAQTDAEITQLVNSFLAGGGGQAMGAAMACDMNLKENITPVSAEAILEMAREITVSEWNYKGQDDRHLGPMAQEFNRMFCVNSGLTSISPVDAFGVCLASIQALANRVEELQERLDEKE